MTSQTPLQQKNAGRARNLNEALEPVDELVQRLVGLLTKEDAALDGCNDSIPEEIILDRTVGEVRYLLIRMPAAISGHAPLSPREQEIVRMVADGHPTKVIANVLNISCWTVTAHLRRIFMKLGVTSRPAMVARLAETGRKWYAPIQSAKPPSYTTRIADHLSQPAANRTQSPTTVRA